MQQTLASPKSTLHSFEEIFVDLTFTFLSFSKLMPCGISAEKEEHVTYSYTGSASAFETGGKGGGFCGLKTEEFELSVDFLGGGFTWFINGLEIFSKA